MIENTSVNEFEFEANPINDAINGSRRQAVTGFDALDMLTNILQQHADPQDLACFLYMYAESMEYAIEMQQSVDKNFIHELIMSLDRQYLLPFYIFFRRFLSWEHKIDYAGMIVEDTELPAECRALFWHLISEAGRMPRFVPHQLLSKNVLHDNAALRDKWYHYYALSRKHHFMDRISMTPGKIVIPEMMQQAVALDSDFLFEISQTVAVMDINLDMVAYLLSKHAGNCLKSLFDRHLDEFFQGRTPEEWLFLVCRNLDDVPAAEIVRKIHEKSPESVAKALDPWGNNLLWNTLTVFRGISRPALQQTLLDLGCNPDYVNPYGLSYNLVQRMDPKKDPCWKTLNLIADRMAA